ncbi:lysosomal alpha-mannosidase-like [Ixodes scapularis]
MPANFITRWFGISQPLFQRDRHEANLFHSQEELFISEQRNGKNDAREGERGYTVSSDQKPPLRGAAGAVYTGVRGRPFAGGSVECPLWVINFRSTRGETVVPRNTSTRRNECACRLRKQHTQNTTKYTSLLTPGSSASPKGDSLSTPATTIS